MSIVATVAAAPAPRTVLVPTAVDAPALRTLDLTHASDEDLVAAFAVAAAHEARVHRESRVMTANYLNGVLGALSKELRGRGLRACEKLLPLLAAEDRDVRLEAAYRVLWFAPERAVAPLEALAAPPYKHNWSENTHNATWLLEKARTGGFTHQGPDDVLVSPAASPSSPEEVGSPASPLSDAQLDAMIAKHRLTKQGEAIKAARRPAIRMVRRLAHSGTALPLGTSRLGGLPDLPEGWSWPARRGRPLSLLAQLDLADIGTSDWGHELPARGRLYFFYDADSQPGICSEVSDPADAGTALFDDGEGPLHRAERPAMLVPDLVFPPATLSFLADWTLPSNTLPTVLAQALKTDARVERYQTLTAAVEGQRRPSPVHGAPGHQLLGLAHPEQDPMEELLSDNYTRPEDWRLLAEFHSDEDVFAGPWGDAGKIYFWIRHDDLRARRFERTVVLAQCG